MSWADDKIIDFGGRTLNEHDLKQRTEELRKLVLGHNKLKIFRTDDPYLLRFLHCTYFSVPSAFKRMQDHLDTFILYPDWFPLSSPKDSREDIKRNARAFLPAKDKCGRRIYVVVSKRIHPSNSSPQKEAQLDELWFESVMDDPETQACGVAVIVDVSDFSFSFVPWLNPENVKISTRKAELYPCKEIVYHIVNCSFMINVCNKLVEPFLPEKVKKTIKFHFGDWSSLHQHISAEVLPPDYGGTGPAINFDALSDELLDRSSEIEEKIKYYQIALTRGLQF